MTTAEARLPGALTAFVGRQAELGSVSAALAGGPCLVVIEGEAGVGKTRLVQQALLSIRPGYRTLDLACPPLVEPFPLGPVVDSLQRLDVSGLDLSPLTGALRPLFPEWVEILPPALEPLEDPKATRHRLLRAILEVVTKLGVDLLVLEDAQWCDPTTLELLLMMLAAPEPTIRLVVTYRPTDVPPGLPLLRLTSWSAPSVPGVRVRLEPLDLGETRSMVAALFDTDEVSTSFVEFLHERTDGIPFALEETLSLLRERGDIIRRDGEWTRRSLAELEVPSAVRDSVVERVRRLGAAAQRVLQGAAVLGVPSEQDVLEQVTGDLADPVEGITEAVEAGLLGEASPGRFGFRHVLAARAVEEDIPASRRRLLHARAARSLERLTPAPVTRLSRHCREAGDLAGWSRYAVAAADLALQSGDDAAAVVLLVDLAGERGLGPAERVRAALRLGDAAAWGAAALGGLGEKVTRALEEVLDEVPAPAADRGQIRLSLGRLWLQLGEFDAAAAHIEAAVTDLETRPDLATRAMISLAWPRGSSWTAERHHEWLERASRSVERVPEGPERTWLEVDRTSVLLMLGDDRGWQAAADLRTDRPTAFEQRQVARCLMNVGHVAIAWGRDPAAREALEEAVTRMRETGYRRLLHSAELTLAFLDWQGGRWSGLAADARQLLDDEDTLPEARLEARLVLALLDMAAGEHEKADAELELVLGEARRRGLADTQMAPAAALGRVRLLEQGPAAALEVTTPSVDTVVRKALWTWASGVIPVHVDALVGLGRLDEADALVQRFGSGLGDRDAPAPEAALHLSHGIVEHAHGQDDRATTSLTAAAAAWARIPRPYDELLVGERIASVELRTGRREAGLARLADVEERLHRLGARRDADRVARILRDQGVEVARVWRGGRRGYGNRLSPREREVVRLVSEGMTNREIAQTLFLSPRTVDRHLGSVMKKLQVRSRTEVALAARDGDLLDTDGGPADA